MLAAGLRKGDRVGVWSPNRYEWTQVQYAAAKVGAILVTINPAYRVNELKYVLAQSGCRWVFAAEQFRDSDFAGMLREVESGLPKLERMILFGTTE
jgi:fatty-acyl-CoA synthase